MADRDNKIRVIVEGIDKLSGPLRGVSKSLEKLRGDIKKTSKEIEDLPPLFGGTGETVRNEKGQFQARLNQTAALRRDLRSLKKEVVDFKKEFSKGFNFASGMSEDINEALFEFQKFRDKAFATLTEAQDKERSKVFKDIFKLEQAADVEIEKVKKRIRSLRRQIAEEEDVDAQERLQKRVADERAEAKRIRKSFEQLARERREELKRQFQAQRNDIRALNKTDFINIINEKEAAAAKRELDEIDGKLAKLGRRAGFALGDLSKGFRAGRLDIKELSEAVEQSGNRFQRFGLAIGNAVSSVDKFVNLRWLFITGVITIFFAVIVRLGAALVALAASAIQAGAALGGAFVAGVAQAIPAIGLLAAAMQRLGVIMDAVKLADKNSLRDARDAADAADKKRQATQRLADAQYSLKQALESVADAEYGLKKAGEELDRAFSDRTKAFKALKEARVDAAQDIVDANLEERDAVLSLAEAELAVLDAKERLRKEQEKKRGDKSDLEGAQLALKEANERLKLAREQGDQAEISAAAQQVAIAQQNLSAIQDQAAEVDNSLKSAQLAVKRAEINREQAAIRARRSRQDAAEKRKKGVEGSDGVVSAKEQLDEARSSVRDAQRNVVLSNRQLRDSIRGVTIARRELADAEIALADKTNFLTSQQNQLNEALADFSPSEKKLFNSLKRLSDEYQKIFSGTPQKDGILGPINEALAEAIDNVLVLLKDPEIVNALSDLSEGIGDAISEISKFTMTDEFKEFLLFFIREGTKNLPNITKSFLNIAEALMNIAVAAAPLFADLLESFTGFTGKIKETTDDREGLEDFFASAGKHLDSWIQFAKAVGNLILALTGGAAPSGKTLLDDITEKLNEWAEWIRDNPEEVNKFFTDLIESLENLTAVFGKFLPKFVKAFSSDDFTAFSKVILDVIVPGLLLMIKLLGIGSRILTNIFEIPIIGDLAKYFVTIAVAEKALNKLFPFSQKLTEALRHLAKNGFQFLFNVIKNPSSVIASLRNLTGELKAFVSLAKEFGVITAFFTKFPKFEKFILALWKALRYLPVIIGIIGRALMTLFITNPWIAAAVAVIGIIVLLDRKFHFLRPTIEFIGKVLEKIFNWIKDHWRLVVTLLVGPIALAVFKIIKHWDTIKDKLLDFTGWLKDTFFKLVYDPFIKPFVSAYNFIIDLFKALPRVISELIKKIPGLDKLFAVGERIGGFFSGVTGAVKGAAKGAVKAAGDAADAAEADLAPDKKTTATDILKKDMEFHGGLIKRLRKQGLTDEDILRLMIKNKILLRKNFKKRFGIALTEVEGFGGGGVAGLGKRIASTDTVPAMLTPGEWILNSGQQRKLAAKLGMNVNQAKAFLFGTNMGSVRPGEGTTGTKPSKSKAPLYYGTFTLVPQEDDNGVTVWFIEMADGTFGQVTARDAKKIQASGGNYIPGYVKRNAHGFKQMLNSPYNNIGELKFAGGGVVPHVRRFAEGGVVQNPGFGNTVKSGATVEQNFNVTTVGETDWNYVMRLAAINAQESF